MSHIVSSIRAPSTSEACLAEMCCVRSSQAVSHASSACVATVSRAMVSRVIVPVSAPITPSAVSLEHLGHRRALELAQLGQLDLANESDSKSNRKRATEIKVGK